MAELDPIVAKILLKGDDELITSLKKIGSEAEEHFEKLSKAVAKGITPSAALSGSLGLVEAAVSGITAALIVFIEQQTELSQKTELLANAFGTTAGQLQELETIFASSGVKVEQFERFANRLTITIAREWPQIAESIRTYADENDAATLRVSNAILRVQDAQKALGDREEERAAQSTKDNDAVAASYLKLQFAAQHAASEQLGALQAVRGAQLSVTAAEQHLAELEGRPPSKAEKENLALAQARQAVDSARKGEADARLADQEKAANATLKQAQLEQAYDDVARKAAKNARDDAEQRVKDQNAVKEAVIARGEAEERANKFALTNVVSIKNALDGITQGNKAAATAINLAEVSVNNLTKAIVAQAAEGHKGPGNPTGYETLRSVSNLLAKDTDHLIDRQQRLAVVNHLAATSMQAIGSSGSEILDVLENDADKIEALQKKIDDLDKSVDPNVIKAFRGALAELRLEISFVSQAFAAAIAPAFTAFLNAINSSLTESNGLLHNFISGIKSVGEALSAIGTALATTIEYFAKLFHVDSATLLKGALLAIGFAIAAAIGPITGMVAAIGLVIVAIGAVRDHWKEIKEAAEKAWASVKDNAVVKFFEGVLDVILRVIKGLAIIDKATSIGGKSKSAAAAAAQAADEANGAPPPGFAGGGHIRGGGTATSDSIMARLSDGEFVTKTAAVQKYGVDFFHALNNMTLPGFATGGLVGVPARIGGGTNPIQASRPLNLTIDGRTFGGFRGPANVVESLANFAVSRQTSSAGRQPSWVK